ncbi:MAG: 1,4-dihydroxy-2-naphthoate polyprenyltransferase [Nitriliruptoraceae bacterium]
MNAYLEAARPRTLPAAVAPVVVGTVAASTPTPQLSLGRAGLALIVALSLQVGVNYANDYFDGVKGVDTEDRAGPRRAVASGLITPPAMRLAIGVALVVASLAGLTLAMLVGWELLLVGAVAILATLAYSGGPKPYASVGLGEVMVFVFFGLVATAGSAYVQDGRLSLLPVLTAVPMGLFAVALLVVNNLRDIPTDRAVGKTTLAVKLGDRQTRVLFGMLVAGAYLSLAPIGLYAANLWFLVPLLSLWSARRALAIVRDAVTAAALVPGLKATSQTQLLFAGLLTVALLMNRIAIEGGAV